MTRARSRRLLAAAAVPLLAVTVAACGAEPAGPAEDAATASGPGFDQTLHERLPRDVRDAGRVLVATDASYPPASFFGPDGRTILGFEPDLAAAIGTVLGVDLEFVMTEFDDALSQLESGEVDAVMAAMTDTPEREAQADFVNYFSAGTSVVVQRGNPHAIADLADLCGRAVAVEVGTVQVDLVRRNQARCGDDPILLRTRPTNADALVELRTGRAAAVLNDYPPAVYLTTDERTRADYQLASDTQYEPGLYGIAVSKERTQLRDALHAALDRLLATGEYARVLARWDVEHGAVKAVSINGGG
jgi:polar amino acid transport system substrate-binding protein